MYGCVCFGWVCVCMCVCTCACYFCVYVSVCVYASACVYMYACLCVRVSVERGIYRGGIEIAKNRYAAADDVDDDDDEDDDEAVGDKGTHNVKQICRLNQYGFINISVGR